MTEDLSRRPGHGEHGGGGRHGHCGHVFPPALRCSRRAFLAALSAAILGIALCSRQASAQEQNLKIDRITAQQGQVSHNNILAILQDRLGFIWLATQDGVNRYDGHSFTIFRNDPTDSLSIADGSVDCIFEDSRGMLWFGTQGAGLDCYDRITNRFTHYRHDPRNPNSIGEGIVTSICEDGSGRLWIGTSATDAGVSVLEPVTGRVERLTHQPDDPHSLSSDFVTAVCRDSSGRIWVGTYDGGMNLYDPSICGFINHHTIPAFNSAPLEQIRQLYAEPDGTIWVLAFRRLYLLNPRDNSVGKFDQYHISDTPRVALTTVFRDRSGTLWIGTSGRGGVVVDSAHHRMFGFTNHPSNPNSLSSNQINCFAEDNSGNIWIGTNLGVCKVNRRRWQFQNYLYDPYDPTSIGASVVRSIFIDSRRRIWIGTAGDGINRVDSGSRVAMHYSVGNTPTNLTDVTINTAYPDALGRVWFGTNKGLNALDTATGTFRRYEHSDADTTSLTLGGIWSILDDRDGGIWVGSMGGLNRFDPATGRAIHYRNNPADTNSLSNDKILCMLRDHLGRIWVGTDFGLNLFDPLTGRCRRYVSVPSDTRTLSNNRIWFIHEDRHGILWIGTSGGGFNRFDPATGIAKRYMERDGLINNTVCAIVEDDRERLWISTNNGLSRFDPASGRFRNYYSDDGLAIYDFHFKACARDTEGYIYFGGTYGLLRFHPDSLDLNRTEPALRITSFKTVDTAFHLDTSAVFKRRIDLEHNNNFFTIEFAALDFTNPSRNVYRYMLEGFDSDWREADGTRPIAEYTNVPPGSYRFRLEGSNCDGVWNHAGLTLGIEVHPAFWQTWAFLICCLAAVALLITLAALYRIRDVRRKERLNRKLVEYQLQALRAQMNPHFIFNSLNSILHFIVGHDTESAHRYLSKFSRLMRATLENSKAETISLADELEQLRLYLDLESLRFDNSFTYRITVDPAINTNNMEVPPMLIQPYVENAIKHGLAHRSSPGTLTIDFRQTPAHLVCSIIDNGVGRIRAAQIQKNALVDHRSYGMEITRNRLDTLSLLSRQRYTLEVTDLVDPTGAAAGTRIDLYIPQDVAAGEEHPSSEEAQS
ncbi:MAG: histidine kinase [Bacteroidetes bacterium]|nr:histidine kinase [Bacteroidota bacterium]